MTDASLLTVHAGRTVCWFSCGAASAVASKLICDEIPDAIVVRCIVENEHPDNNRFAVEISRWIGKEIIELRSKRYVDCWDVWRSRRFLNSPAGALCSVEMKKVVRRVFQKPDDMHVFGFTAEEKKRAETYLLHNPESARFPLIEKGITKSMCFEILMGANIELPVMYRLGYNNANCIGCVKGGKGYWNKIRRDFPEVFKRMSDLEDEIGATVINGTPLRELPINAGRKQDLHLPECGLFCGKSND